MWCCYLSNVHSNKINIHGHCRYHKLSSIKFEYQPIHRRRKEVLGRGALETDGQVSIAGNKSWPRNWCGFEITLENYVSQINFGWFLFALPLKHRIMLCIYTPVCAPCAPLLCKSGGGGGGGEHVPPLLPWFLHCAYAIHAHTPPPAALCIPTL